MYSWVQFLNNIFVNAEEHLRFSTSRWRFNLMPLCRGFALQCFTSLVITARVPVLPPIVAKWESTSVELWIEMNSSRLMIFITQGLWLVKLHFTNTNPVSTVWIKMEAVSTEKFWLKTRKDNYYTVVECVSVYSYTQVLRDFHQLNFLLWDDKLILNFAPCSCETDSVHALAIGIRFFHVVSSWIL